VGGSNGDSSPARDGKGEIDVVDYLVKESIVKNFSGVTSGAVFVGKSAKSIVTVNNNEIIEDTEYTSVFRGIYGHGVSNKTTTYNDYNITTRFFLNEQPVKIKTFYRYVNNNELKSKSKTEYSVEYMDYDYDVVVGTIKYELSEICTYIKEDKIRFKKNQLGISDEIRREGNYLAVECIEEKITTQYIDKEYIDLNEKYKSENEKSEVEVSTRIEYYEKEIGYIGYIFYPHHEQAITWLFLDN